MRLCAICSKPTGKESFALCNKCWKTWKPQGEAIPAWLRALIYMDNNVLYGERKRATREVSYESLTDADLPLITDTTTSFGDMQR
jgi:hypothetical protein